MILQGELSLPASRDRVWSAIWDVPTMASWVPGCSGAEQIGENAYRVHLVQQVSMIKAAFDLLLTVTDAERPDRLAFSAIGEDKRVASNVQIESEIRLVEEGPGATKLFYRHDVNVFGRLGALGFPVIQRKAREAEVEFARRATQALQAGTVRAEV